jgi:hypothetical protein
MWSSQKRPILKGNQQKGNPLKGNPLKGNPLKGNPLKGNPLKGNPLKGNPLKGPIAKTHRNRENSLSLRALVNGILRLARGPSGDATPG